MLRVSAFFAGAIYSAFMAASKVRPTETQLALSACKQPERCLQVWVDFSIVVFFLVALGFRVNYYSGVGYSGKMRRIQILD